MPIGLQAIRVLTLYQGYGLFNAHAPLIIDTSIPYDT